MRKKREYDIELARILASMIVVGVHVCLPQIVNNQPDPGRTFISCFLADGVAVFWLITGCFLFQNTSYGKLIKRTGKHIVIPMAVLSVFIFYTELGMLQAALFPNGSIGFAAALNLGMTVLGLIFRYLLEYGEVSNTYNFTAANVALHLFALTILPLMTYISRKQKS